MEIINNHMHLKLLENSQIWNSVIITLSFIVFSAAWLLFCLNIVNTSFKLNWEMTWNRLCVSIAYTLIIKSAQPNQSDLILPVLHNQLPCILSLHRTLEYHHLFCIICSQLEPQPLLFIFCSDQQIPTVLFFCIATHWSVALHSHTNSSTCFPSPRPSPEHWLFWSCLHFALLCLFTPLVWPSFWLRRRWNLSHLLFLLNITSSNKLLFSFYYLSF